MTNAIVLDAILRSDFGSFVQKSFVELNPGCRFEANWHIDAVTYHLARVMGGQTTRLIVNLPPRSLKSHIGSVAFPAFALGQDPTQKIICVSYSQDLADKHASDFRRVMTANWYRRAFPHQSLLKNAESELQTAQGGFRFATSVGGTLTGRGGNTIIIDDPLNAAEAHSKTNREKVNSWFSNSLLSRLDDKQTGTIIVIMQRLHPEDLTGYLLERGNWDNLCLPAIAPEDKSIAVSDHRTYSWKKNEVLHPAREPLASLDQLKAQLGAETFNSQYLQAPLPETGNLLKRPWLQVYENTPVRQDGDQVVQSWDTAMKATDTSDYSVCLTFLVRNRSRYFLLDVYRDRPEFPELSKLVVSHASKYQADAILIEDAVSGTSLIQMARGAGLQGVIGIRHSADKVTRMYTQTPKLEARSLFVPKSASWLPDFMAEYLAFPRSRHDDQIDCLSQFLEWRTNRENSYFSYDMGFEDDRLYALSGPTGEDILRWRGAC